MKSARTTVQVRIEVEQKRRLQEIADVMPGATVTGLVEYAIEQFLDIEGPVHLAAHKQVRLKLVSCREKSASCLERQPVREDVAL